MNTLHLKYALEVAKTHSITQAAENLFMAQPNLSKAIKELETTLNITIFERSTRGVVPTGEGAVFLEYANNVMSEITKMQQIANSVSNNVMKICIPKSFTYSECVLKFIEMNRDVTLEMDFSETTPYNALTGIIYNNYKLAVVRVSDEDNTNFQNYCTEHNLTASEIWKFKCKAVVSASNPIASNQILVEALMRRMIRICDVSENVPYHMKSFSAEDNFKKIYLNDLSLCTETLKTSGKYYMLDSPTSKPVQKKNGISQLNTEKPVFMYDYFVCKKNYNFSYAEKMFLDCISSVKNTIDFVERVNY